jgi:hypothetical protein
MAFVGSGATALRSVTTYALLEVAVPKIAAARALSQKPVLTAQALTPELRHRGYNECNPYDFVGLGPYAPYRKLRVGRIAIPQKGGHTKDFGYDVLVHFHGQTAMRMTLAQVARGVAFVGIDLGIASGPYQDAFASAEAWPALKRSIESALKAQSGDPRAHIRHIALTAWSAGYGAVNEILKHDKAGIDAVVLLDGLHAAWDPTHNNHTTGNDVIAGPIAPTLEFAKMALKGEKIFVFSHSEIDPPGYPSTRLTADMLMRELGLKRHPVANSSSDKFGLYGTVDTRGVHIWSYRGGDKAAHCTHLTHIDRAVRDILEPAWHTPAMDRNVPPTPAPKLGPAPASSSQGEPEAKNCASSAEPEGKSASSELRLGKALAAMAATTPEG